MRQEQVRGTPPYTVWTWDSNSVETLVGTYDTLEAATSQFMVLESQACDSGCHVEVRQGSTVLLPRGS